MRPDTGHPWVGRLAPNLTLTTDTGDTGLATLLTTGHGLLLNLANDSAIREAAAGWVDRVATVDATCSDHPELRAIFLRPDGHTAWLHTTDHDHVAGLHQALQHWYGPAAQARAPACA